MDQKRLITAIAISLAILITFQLLLPKTPKQPQQQQVAQSEQTHGQQAATRARTVANPAYTGTEPEAVPPPKNTPRVPINAPKVAGSINLRGGLLDDLVLRDYHEEVSPSSPLVRILEPQTDPEPNYIQYGWTSDTPGVKLPDDATLWTASGKELTQDAPLTLTWDNGAGLLFSITYTIDDNYMFGATQTVKNTGSTPVALHPFERVRRDYQPVTAGFYILHEGPVGVLDGRLTDPSYATIKSAAEKHDGVGQTTQTTGGWGGITDKYWLTAAIPSQDTPETATFGYGPSATGPTRYGADFITTAAQTIAPGADASLVSRAFAGAKEVHLLEHYEAREHVPLFSYAVDFGYFWFLTKPIFYALDWLNGLLGNFGLAIMVFTVFAKALFFPARQQVLSLDEQDEAARPENDCAAGALQGRADQAAERDDGALQDGEGEPGGGLPAHGGANPGVLLALQGDFRHHRDAPRPVLRLGPRPSPRSTRPTCSTCSACCLTTRPTSRHSCISRPGR